MPQPTLGDVHISAALTMIATAYVQGEGNYVADKVFPIVPVEHQTDQYFVWTKGDWFRDEAQLRADGSESAGTGMGLTTSSYAAQVRALHKDIGAQVRNNADPAVDVDVATTKFLMQRMLITRERNFASNFFATGKWGTDITGTAGGTPGSSTPAPWDDDVGGDPFTDIAVGQTAILQKTGFKPNKLTLSWPVYQALRKHPLIIDRIKYSNPTFAGTITPQLLASAFDVDQVLVAEAVYNSAAEGNTDSFSFIMGKNALLSYAPPAPGLMIPSAGYIFAWRGLASQFGSIGIRVNQIPMPWLGLETIRTEAEMAYDMKTVGTDLGYFFSNIVS